jgi:plasmid replication initiation protein
MKIIAAVTLILASLSIPAFAAKNAQSITLMTTTKIASTQLSAGDYKVSWTGSGSAVQVTFTQKGKTVATISATAVPAKNPSMMLEFNTVNGVNVLNAIDMEKLKLVFTNAN